MKNTIKRFRKKMHRGIAAAAALFLMSAMLLMIPANAREAYTYTVRLYSGAQGVFNESALANVLRNQKNQAVSPASIGAKLTVSAAKDEVIISGIPASDGVNPYRIVYDANLVTVTNQKYLAYTNFRESGRDNKTINTANFAITEDLDLVVGYYIASGIVSYTVNYVDEDGNPVFTTVNGASVSSETHYGNAGDRLVVAFPYVEGYQPRAYSGVLTLSADASKNVFNFPYREIAPEEPSSEEESSSSEESSSAESSSSGSEASSSAAESSSSAEGGAVPTDAAGNPVPTNADGSPVATDASGNPVYPTDAEGNPIPTDENGNLAPTDEEGNVIEPSGEETESDTETESGSEEETAESETPESTSEDIQDTMEFSDETSGPAASSDFSGESSGEGGGSGESGDGNGQKVLNVIRHPAFIAGSIGGLAGIAVLVTVLVKKGRKKN